MPQLKKDRCLQRCSPDSPLQNESFGWHLQFLTILGITICTTCFIFGLVADVTNNVTCFTIKNYIALVAAPIEIVISILYWGLRAISRDLVVPPDLPLPPFLYDLTFHFFPALLLAIDALLLSPPWPSSPMNPQAPLLMLVMSTAVAFLYWWWIEICYLYNGFYPYPIFDMLSTHQRIGLFAVSGSIMWVVGGVLRASYAYLNGYEQVEGLQKMKRAKNMAVEGKWE
jgi:hypothetical protein